MGKIAIRGAASLALLIAGSAALAEELRIHYAEPVAARVTGSTHGPQKTAAQTLTFDAFGRRFDLALEPNDRLLASWPAADRARLNRYRVLKGRVAGIAHSWVRITLVNEAMHGAIWDGSDLYTLAPTAAVADALIDPIADASATNVIYRLADTHSDADTGSCVVLSKSGAVTGVRDEPRREKDAADARARYLGLVSELRQQAALLTAGSQLEVAVLGDFEFSNRFANDAAAAAIARMNIVDGIFSEQVDVAIVVAEVRISTTADDPFASSNAQLLINEVAQHRNSTPVVRERGLAHLMTGRELDGNTIGIAYIDALCEPFFGVSVSEGWRDVTTAALIAAHELGHNFGAPHDNEPGSPCASTGPGLLMDPVFNTSAVFSQCSRLQMAPRIEAAPCITATPVSDAALELPESPVSAVVGDPVVHAITVRSIGAVDVDSVEVVLNFTNVFGAISVESVMAGGTPCVISGTTAACTLGRIAAGDSRRIEMSMRGNLPGTFRVNATLTAANDRNLANNSGFTDFAFDSALRLTVAPSPVNGQARLPVSFVVDVAVIGSSPIENAQFQFDSRGLTVNSLVVPGGSCSPLSLSRITCSVGTLAIGTSMAIEVSVTGARSGSFTPRAHLIEPNPGGNPVVVARDIQVNLATRADVSVSVAPARHEAIPGQTVQFTYTVSSSGPESAEDVRVDISPSAPEVIQTVVPSAGSCERPPPAHSFNCSFGTIEAGDIRTIVVTARNLIVANFGITARSFSTANDVQGNDQADGHVFVRHEVDVAVVPVFPLQSAETLSFTAFIELRSLGSAEARDVTATVNLPASFEVLAATLDNGTCSTIAGAVTCTIASLLPDRSANLRLNLRGSDVGTFTSAINVTATNDRDPQNNATMLELRIVPLVDASVESANGPMTVAPDEEFDAAFLVRSGPRPLIDVSVQISTSHFLLQSIQPSVGACTSSGSQHVCQLGAFAAGATIRIDLRLRPLLVGGAGISAFVSTPGDLNSNNNSASAQVTIPQYQDAGLLLPQARPAALVNADLVLPLGVQFSDGSPLADVQLTATLPDSVTFVRAAAVGGTCVLETALVRCSLGAGQGNTIRNVEITVRRALAGRVATTVRVLAPQDAFLGNNEGTLELDFNNPPPPPSNSGGGGGGGGSLGLTLLSGLLLARFVAVSRRFPH